MFFHVHIFTQKLYKPACRGRSGGTNNSCLLLFLVRAVLLSSPCDISALPSCGLSSPVASSLQTPLSPPIRTHLLRTRADTTPLRAHISVSAGRPDRRDKPAGFKFSLLKFLCRNSDGCSSLRANVTGVHTSQFLKDSAEVIRNTTQ